ncbi:GGDEF domain-containing protein [Erwinia persicina]|uniref:GGDEF domain-containing protein n=1 Tax=Erwinia persicina TaxID=55211 RepID=UPI000787B0D8|nr:GGDEF domain-containing protein [Erwinia persicina]AXU96490.1 GGDEF domain-containing protein [Erwinia persicina]HBI08094.1 GGDEF domain-containing protein [Erwinia persicina]
MKLQSYDELLNSKHRLSLMLFLFLNTATAVFSMLNVNRLSAPMVTLPTATIIILSIMLLIWMVLKPLGTFPLLNSAALITGVLWAWQIGLKYQQNFYFENSFLLISLVSVFFISAIALGDHLLAFCLHTAPASATVLILDHGQNTFVLLFTIILPLFGFTLHHLMLRRRDNFTRRLVSQLYEEKETYSDLSMLDPLTGLYNRRGLKNRLENILDNHAGSHFVLLLDIDNFKAYNDNYGHAMGDQALARVSVAIRDAVRSRDIVTRYGGEEFLVLLTNVNESIALKLAERIRQYVLDLEIPHRFNDRVATHVTISAGIAPLMGEDFDNALANADRALYLAKNQGRNTILSHHDLVKKHLSQAADAL